MNQLDEKVCPFTPSFSAFIVKAQGKGATEPFRNNLIFEDRFAHFGDLFYVAFQVEGLGKHNLEDF